MKRRYKDARTFRVANVFCVLLVGSMVLLAAAAVLANGLGYTLDWWTVDGGGGFSEGSGYTLGGTAGQPDAGAVLTGGGYTLVGGMWAGAGPAASSYSVYLPLTLKEG